MKDISKGIIRYFGIIFVILIFMFILTPLIWVILTAFKAQYDIFTFPPVWFFRPKLDSFIIAFQERPILRGLLNSTIVAVLVTFISLALGTSAGYVLARIRMRGKVALSMAILTSRTVPAVVMLLPYFLLMYKLGLRDTHLAVVISHCSFSIPFAIWLQWGFIEQIPFELEEAAVIDGSSRLGAIVRVILPLSTPSLMSCGILIFIESWNEFPFALVLTSRVAKTLPVEIVSFITPVGIGWGQMFATSVIIMIPSILFISLASKKLTSGLTMGALKG